MFVYLIQNSENGRCYIGKTARSVAVRWLEHLRHARNGYKDGPLYDDLRKFAASCFVVTTLFVAKNEADLNDAEERFIETYSALESYNATPYARGGLDSDGRTIKRKFIPKVQRRRIAEGMRRVYAEGRRARVPNHT